MLERNRTAVDCVSGLSQYCAPQRVASAASLALGLAGNTRRFPVANAASLPDPSKADAETSISYYFAVPDVRL